MCKKRISMTNNIDLIEDIIDKYFYLFSMPIFLLAIVSIKNNINKIVRTKPEMKPTAKTFIKGLTVSYILCGLLLQTFQLLGGYGLVDSFHFDSNTNIFHFLGLGTIIICYVLLIYWVYFKNGAEILSIFSPALIYSDFNPDPKIQIRPRTVKIFFFLMICGGIVCLIFV